MAPEQRLRYVYTLLPDGPSTDKIPGAGTRSVDATGLGTTFGIASIGGVLHVVGDTGQIYLGVASAEQIRVAKVVNVGTTSLENVGSLRKTVVGDEFTIECGLSRFVMRKDGTVLIYGSNFTFEATGAVHINGATIDLN